MQIFIEGSCWGSPISLGPWVRLLRAGWKKIFLGVSPNERPSFIWTISSTLHWYSHSHTCNIHLKLRQAPLTMLLVWSSPSTGIQWPIIVRHFLIQFVSTPPMINICIPSCGMESLNFGEGYGHPHQSATSLLYTDTREVSKWIPSKLVYISVTILLEH